MNGFCTLFGFIIHVTTTLGSGTHDNYDSTSMRNLLGHDVPYSFDTHQNKDTGRFDATSWLNDFKALNGQQSKEADARRKALRSYVGIQNADVINLGTQHDTYKFDFKSSSMKSTPHSTFLQDEDLNNIMEFHFGRDCITEARRLQTEFHLNPSVLNMANQFYAGGAFKRGAGAQEENLFRRTNYASALSPFTKGPTLTTRHGVSHDYNYQQRDGLGEFGVIFSKDVTVYRGLESEGYPVWEQKDHFKLDFVAAAMYECRQDPELKRMPRLDEMQYADRMKQFTEEHRDGIERKIRNVLQAALLSGSDSIVLGAWGTGGFKCNPEVIGESFYQVLVKEEWAKRFKKVTFAVIEDHNSRKFNTIHRFRDAVCKPGKFTHCLHTTE